MRIHLRWVACGGLGLALLAGCGSAQQPSPVSGSAASSPAAASAPEAPASAAVSTAAMAPARSATKSLAATHASSTAAAPMSIPPYLCDATDVAQNAADAYMGALSAGQLAQAQACVLPGSVPAATTRSLLATVHGTAVYLPRAGVDGPSVFGYQGNGKRVDVTITREPDGRFWVTRVSVSDA